MKHLLTIVLTLTLLTCCTTPARREAMRHGLDSINQRNRNDLPFTVQDVKPYVQFFDDHGTPNDRLLAHYLMGRAYHEQGEAPMALECYQKAIECADTTVADCDYAQMSRVYGQMAEIFCDQGLYRQQLSYDRLAEKCAWQGRDTLAELINYEQQSVAYRELSLIDSAIIVIENVADKYVQYHYNADAAIALGGIVRTLINRGDIGKAIQYLLRYESESNLFDQNGNIQKGREIYYHVKGLLQLKEHHFDSAEYWFRKELRDGKDFNNQNAGAKGLAELYQVLHRPDSAAKYFQYAYAMNDSTYAQMTTETVERMQSMFNYSRHQEKARREEKKAADRAVIIWICIGVLLLLLFVTYIIISRLYQKNQEAKRKYEQSTALIEQGKKDLAKLRANEEVNRELIAEKEQTIREQETILKSLLRKNASSQSVADKKLKATAIYDVFVRLSITGQQPSSDEWSQIQAEVYNAYPGFRDFMERHAYLLNEKEQRTCLLIRAGFTPKSISNMIGVAAAYISMLRSGMSGKLFNLSSNSKQFDKMIKDIY